MEKTGLVVFLVIVAVVLSLVNLFAVFGINQVDEDALSAKVTAQVVSQIPEPTPSPTAAEIAALIEVPQAPAAPEITIPEFTENERINDIWKEQYADEIEELEIAAYDVALEELEKHDYDDLVDWFEGTIEDIDEVEDIDVKDYTITVVDLGLDDDEDKVATVEFELKVRYSLLEGVDDDFKKTVYATATVTFEEGDFDDEEVELVFA